MKKLLFLTASLAIPFFHLGAVTEADRAARESIVQSIRNRVYTQVLPNGMTVICYCTPNTNKVVVGTLVGAGYRHEQPDEWGIAHILEHMWFKGTPSRPEGFQDELCRRFGMVSGRDANAHTWYDHTYYYSISDTENWRTFGDLYADCLQNLALTPASLTSELGAVSQEVKLSGYDQNSLDFVDFLPFNHPYSHSGIGYKEEIFTYSPEQVRRFYEKYYTPDRMTFLVCGNVEPSSVFDYAANAFASFNRPNTVAEKPISTSLPFYAGFSNVTKTIYHSKLERIYSFMWVGAPQNTIDAAALEYIAFALDKRLNQELVDKHGHCFSTECKNYSFDHTGIVQIQLKPKESFYDFDYEKIVAAEIADIAANGLRDEELEAIYQGCLSDLITAAEDPAILIRKLAFSSVLHSDIFTQYFAHDELLQQVSQQAIRQAAATYLRPILMGKEIRLPIPESEKDAWKELQKAVVEHDKALLATRTRTDEPVASAQVALPEPEALHKRPPLGFEPFSLSNGMTVYFRQEPVSPRCVFSILIQDDEAVALSLAAEGKAFAKYNWDAVLLHGAGSYSKKELDDLCDSLGVHISGVNAPYNPNRPASVMGLQVSALNYNFEEGLRLLKLSLDKPHLPEEILARKKAETCEMILNAQNDLSYRFRDYLVGTLYKECSWRFGEQETLRNIAATTMDDIREVVSLLHDPSKVVGVMSGNFDKAAAQSLAEKYFGHFTQSSPTVNPIAVPSLDAVVSGHVEVANESSLVVGLRMTCVDSEDSAAASILDRYVAGLVWNIRERTGLFYACLGEVLNGTALMPGRICLMAVSVPGNVAATLAEFQSVVNTIYTNGLDDQTVQNLKNECLHLCNKYTYTPASVSREAEKAIEGGHALDYRRQFEERVAAVTTDQVNAVIKKYFDPSTWSFITVGQTIQ